jgi:hypothetical protein
MVLALLKPTLKKLVVVAATQLACSAQCFTGQKMQPAKGWQYAFLTEQRKSTVGPLYS